MRLALVSAIVLGGVLVMASCGASPRNAFDLDAGDGAEGGEAPAETGGGAFPDAEPAQGASCSDDLRDVLDGSGGVLRTCPSDQGCAAGRCVPACEAARQNASMIGCEYYVAHPAVMERRWADSCFAVFVANTWVTPVTLTVERQGKVLAADRMTLLPSGSGKSLKHRPLPGGAIPPGEVAIVFLSEYSSFPARSARSRVRRSSQA
jgi:hypothetical protein